MDHKQLWAPWRLDYVTGQSAVDEASAAPRPTAWLPGAVERCFLCRDVAEAAAAADATVLATVDRTNHVVQHSEHVVMLLNRYPYNNGHLLVAPRLHKAEPADLTDAEHVALMHAVGRAIDALRRLMKPDGFNVGLNLGKPAGAGLPGHLHWHVVPRWNGDTNFMSVTAGVRVIPQSLDATWEALSRELTNK